MNVLPSHFFKRLTQMPLFCLFVFCFFPPFSPLAPASAQQRLCKSSVALGEPPAGEDNWTLTQTLTLLPLLFHLKEPKDNSDTNGVPCQCAEASLSTYVDTKLMEPHNTISIKAFQSPKISTLCKRTLVVYEKNTRTQY